MSVTNIDRLESLDSSKQLTFAYLTCERLYPNYKYFSDNYSFGDPSVLNDSISYIYQNIFEVNVNQSEIDLLSRRVEKNTPDTEDFATIFVSSALDACACVIDTLSFLKTKNHETLSYISSYATDSVDMYVRVIDNIETADDLASTNVISHFLMKREIEIQTGIINYLSSRKTIDYDDINTLIDLQENDQKGNLDL